MFSVSRVTELFAALTYRSVLWAFITLRACVLPGRFGLTLASLSTVSRTHLLPVHRAGMAQDESPPTLNKLVRALKLDATFSRIEASRVLVLII